MAEAHTQELENGIVVASFVEQLSAVTDNRAARARADGYALQQQSVTDTGRLVATPTDTRYSSFRLYGLLSRMAATREEAAIQVAWARRVGVGYILRCEFCDGRYARVRHDQKCCSLACSREFRNERRRVENDARACERCDEPFTPRRSDARYCSSRCRVAAHRARG